MLPIEAGKFCRWRFGGNGMFYRANTPSGQMSALVVYDAMSRSVTVSLPCGIQQNDPRRRNSSSKLHPSCEPTYDSLHLRYGAAVALVNLVIFEQ
jgi:hypothetical protein